ncbi:hypothetical protein ACFQ0M_01445 [Kitasatospora aburaviensis]
MTEASEADRADHALKAKHRAMWALGDYPAVASQIIPELGSELVGECGVGKGDRVLDVAAGSGNAAVPAALRGAEVVASDLTRSSWRSDARPPRRAAPGWTGGRRTRRPCRSRTASSTR